MVLRAMLLAAMAIAALLPAQAYAQDSTSTCADGTVCSPIRFGESGAACTNNACTCPSGFTWVLDYAVTNGGTGVVTKRGYCVKTALVAKCPNGNTCMVLPYAALQLPITCGGDNRCKCISHDHTWLHDVASSGVSKGECVKLKPSPKPIVQCATEKAACGYPSFDYTTSWYPAQLATECCKLSERCYASSSGKAGSFTSCGKQLVCPADSPPCGHGRDAQGRPTKSTKCCKKGQQCIVDFSTGAVRRTKCVDSPACGGKSSRRCGRSLQPYPFPSTEQREEYLEQTKRDDKCCGSGEVCHYVAGPELEGRPAPIIYTRCIKVASCAAGRFPCGSAQPSYGSQYSGYYGSYLINTPNTICCGKGEVCEVNGTAGSGCHSRCIKKADSPSGKSSTCVP